MSLEISQKNLRFQKLEKETKDRILEKMAHSEREILESFKKENFLGQGKDAKVYYLSCKEDFCVKVFNKDSQKEEEKYSPKKVSKEFNNICFLESKYISEYGENSRIHIPKPIAINKKDNYFLMNKIEGLPITYFINENIKVLDNEKEIFEQIKSRLETSSKEEKMETQKELQKFINFMHENNILHNDLANTDNVMIDRNLNLHIIDFGDSENIPEGETDFGQREEKINCLLKTKQLFNL